LGQRVQDLVGSFTLNTTIALDTPFLIYHLEDTKPYSEKTTIILDTIGRKNSTAIISLISYTELLVGILKKENIELAINVRAFFENNPFINILDFRLEIAEYAAKIRSKTNLGLADSIIVATAQSSKAKYLITNDKKILKAQIFDVEVVLLDELI